MIDYDYVLILDYSLTIAGFSIFSQGIPGLYRPGISEMCIIQLILILSICTILAVA